MDVPLYPGDDATLDDYVRYYYSFLYTTQEIIGFLLFAHNVIVSPSTIERVKRRLGLRRRDRRTSIDNVLQTITQLHSNGYNNLGYRAMWRLLTTRLDMSVTQDTVRLCLRALDEEGVTQRQRHRLHRRAYVNNGPNYLVHVDGYDKLKPYGIAIHGAIDGYSRKILWLKAGPSNNNPRYIARFYLNMIKDRQCIPRLIRSDAGTENVILKDLQTSLRFFHNDEMSGVKSFLVGRSSGNQRIERLWRDVSEHVTHFWKNTFLELINLGFLHTANALHIECARFCFLPLIQEQLLVFMDIWNSHRIRQQRREVVAPAGIPNVLYYQPELYNAVDCSLPLPCSLDMITQLAEEYSDEWPVRGCSDEFCELIEFATNEDHRLFPDRKSVV